MRAVLLAIGLVAGLCAQGQSARDRFIRYGLLLDSAQAMDRAGAHAAAVAVFDSAFALVPFMAMDYVPAVLNALAAGRDDRANDLLIQATENGLDISRYYYPELQEFLLSERALPFLNLQEYMKQRWLDHADTAMIRRLKQVGTGQVMRVDAQGGVHMEFDSTAFDRLIELVREHGVPTAASVGDEVYAITHTCMDFAADFPDGPKWQQLLPWLRSAMDRGLVPPDLLASVQDMADQLHHRPMTYGETLPLLTNDADTVLMLDKAHVNAARRAVGLGPIDHLLQRWGINPAKVRFAGE